MSFAARCPFCHIKLNGVPIEREGSSIACPRCENFFTLAPATDFPRGSRGRARLENGTALAVNETSTEQDTPALSSSPGAATGKSMEAGHSLAAEPEPALNRLGVLSFFLGTLALLCASIPGASFLVLPLACTGLLTAGAGVAVPSARKAGLRFVAAGGAVSALVLAIASCWPTLLRLPTPATSSKPSTDTQLVYHHAKRSQQRLAPKQSEWVNASQDGVQQAGVRVRIRGVAVMPVALKDATGQRRRGERSLVIRLRISNAQADRLVEYQSWSAAADKPPRLDDDTGKSYTLKHLGPDQVVGQVQHAWLPMAKWVDDVLVFDAPAGKIEWLRLELPCARVGLEGQFRLEIPRRLIAFQ